MHEKLQAIFDGQDVETVEEWEEALILCCKASKRVPCTDLLFRTDERAKRFAQLVLALSVLEVLLWLAGKRLGIYFDESWSIFQNQLASQKVRAEQICAHFSSQGIDSALDEELKKRGLKNPE